MEKLAGAVALAPSQIPYVRAVDGALRAAGWWDQETWKLAGFTGLAFHVVADKGTCPSSPTAYDWSSVHQQAMDRIGVVSRCVECVGDAEPFEARRSDAITVVKESLDAGVPAVVRTFDYAEFAVVTGYDDDDGVLFVADITTDPDPILYANLGKPHGLPMLFVQGFFDRRPFDPTAAAASSLSYGIGCWRGLEENMFSYGSGYVGGAEAFHLLIDVLRSRKSDPLGLRYIMRVMADSRRALAEYSAWLAATSIMTDLTPVADAYRQAAELEGGAFALIDAGTQWERPLDEASAGEAADLLQEAFDCEERAVEAMERAVA